MKAPTTDGRITGLLNKGSTGHSLAGLAFSLAVISLLSVAVLAAPAGGEFLLTTNAGTGWLTSLRHAGDTNRVEFLRPGQALGAVTLRQTRTSRVLRPGESCTNRFAFRWANNYEEVRELLCHNGGVEVQVAPGMVVPRDLTALLALRTTWKIEGIGPEFKNTEGV